jgi:hypothetical protein
LLPAPARSSKPALTAAQHGDQIELRPGPYRGATTSLGVTIVGSSTARLITTLRVTGLPLGRTFALVGVTGDGDGSYFSYPVIECADNAGRIHLDRVTLRGTPAGFFRMPGAGLVVARCRSLTVTGGAFLGAPAISALASSVVVVGATLTGRDAMGSQYEYYFFAAPGLQLAFTTAYVARCRLLGGAANLHLNYRPLPAEPGLRANDSDVVFTGGPGESCRAGAPFATVPGASAVVAERGTLRIDPTLPLVPTGGLPPIGGTAGVTTARVPALLAVGAGLGGNVLADLYAPAGFAAAACLDSVREPVATRLGELWFDPLRCIVVDAGVVGGSEHRSFALPVPNQRALAGRLLVLQSLTLDPVPTRAALTNPLVFGVH